MNKPKRKIPPPTPVIPVILAITSGLKSKPKKPITINWLCGLAKSAIYDFTTCNVNMMLFKLFGGSSKYQHFHSGS